MDTKLTIKNFRVFDEDGVSIDLKPITILTGCNSSGKSSMTKAVSLLNSFLSQIKKALDNGDSINLAKYRLDFNTYPNSLLGDFNSVVHEGSINREVTFEYSVYSRMLAKEVMVQLIFANGENDDLNDGWLKKVSLSTAEGQIFSTDKQIGSICNINLIKKEGFDFMIVEYLVHCYCGLRGAYEANGITKKEFETQKSLIELELNKYGENYKKNVCAYIRKSNNYKSILARRDVSPDIVLWSKENGSLFMIPIITELNKLAKNEVKKWITKINFAKTPKGFESYTNTIVDDFITSEYTCFGDYFKHYETLYLEEYKFHKFFKSKHIDLRDIGWCETNFESLNDVQFEYLYECVMLLNEQLYDQKNNYYEHTDEGDRYYHFMLNRLFNTFVDELFIEVLTPEWGVNMEYASSSRAKIQRLYSLDIDDDFTRLLKNYFDHKREFKNETNFLRKNSKYEPDSFLNKWISKIGIGSKIKIKVYGEGLGVSIKLYKTENDEKSRLLADEGYGITQLFTVLLQIETAILSAKGERDNGYLGLNDIDEQYKFEDFFEFHYEVKTILIEEPEIHLHPKYQSLLADMMLDAYKNYNIHFIVETHSEYLIRKTQVLVSKMNFESNKDSDKNSPFRTFYFPQDGKPYSLGYRKDGKFAESFGSGFYDEAANLTFEIM